VSEVSISLGSVTQQAFWGTFTVTGREFGGGKGKLKWVTADADFSNESGCPKRMKKHKEFTEKGQQMSLTLD